MRSAPGFDTAPPAGDWLVATVGRLVRLPAGDLSGLDVVELREAAAGLARVRAWVEGCSARVLAGLSRAAGPLAVADVLRGEGGSGREVRRRHDVAVGVGLAPVFAGALESGVVSPDHVVALVKVRNRALVSGAQHGLLDQAVGSTPEQFVRCLAAWDDALDGDGGASAERVRWTKRKLSFGTADDAMGSTTVILPPSEHAILQHAVGRVADEIWRRGDDRTATVAQRRADALLEIVARAMSHPTQSAPTQSAPTQSAPTQSAPCPGDDAVAGESGGAGGCELDGGPRDGEGAVPRPNRPAGLRPTMIVIIDEGSLLGRLDAAGTCRTAEGAAISISEARRLACCADIIPVVLSGDGRVLDVGRKRRWVTDAQWWALLARDQGCVIRGCTAAVMHTEAHHMLAWEHGGRTDVANLVLLCARHHRDLHHCAWKTRIIGARVHITDTAGRTIPTRDPRPQSRPRPRHPPRS